MTDYRQAACKGADPEVFFPKDKGGRGGMVTDGERAALAYCNRCPVQAGCLEDALALRDVHGVRGGKTGEERAALLPVFTKEQTKALQYDAIRVERVWQGRSSTNGRMTLTPLEQEEIGRRVIQKGWNDTEAAETLGLTRPTVTRWRKAALAAMNKKN